MTQARKVSPPSALPPLDKKQQEERDKKDSQWLNNWENCFLALGPLNLLRLELKKYIDDYGSEPLTRFSIINSGASLFASFLQRNGVINPNRACASNQSFASQVYNIVSPLLETILPKHAGDKKKYAHLIIETLENILPIYKANSGDRVPNSVNKAFLHYLGESAEKLDYTEFLRKKALLIKHIDLEEKEPEDTHVVMESDTISASSILSPSGHLLGQSTFRTIERGFGQLHPSLDSSVLVPAPGLTHRSS